MAMECITVTRYIRVGLAIAVLMFAVSTRGVSVQVEQGMATAAGVEPTDENTITRSSLLASSPPTDAHGVTAVAPGAQDADTAVAPGAQDAVTAVAPGGRSPACHVCHIESFSRCESIIIK